MASCAWPPGTSTRSAAGPTGWRPSWSASDVDVLALQETKCRDDQFPEMMFNALGYEVAHVGYSQWNGVAILSRVGIEDVEVGFPGPARTGARTPADGGPRAGRHLRRRPGVEPVRAQRPHARRSALPYKLDWLAALRTTAAGWLADDPAAQIALVGDWNIAPAGRRRLGHERLRPLHARLRARAGGLPGDRRGRVRRRRPPVRARARRLHVLGLRRGCASRAARACGSTSSSAPPRSPPARPAR